MPNPPTGSEPVFLRHFSRLRILRGCSSATSVSSEIDHDNQRHVGSLFCEVVADPRNTAVKEKIQGQDRADRVIWLFAFFSSLSPLIFSPFYFRVYKFSAKSTMGACASLHATQIDAVMISSKTVPREKCPAGGVMIKATTADQQPSITANDNNRATADRKERDRKGLSESAVWPGLYFYRTGKQAATRELQGGHSPHADTGAAETSDTISAVDASCTASAREQDGSADDVHTLIYIFGG